MAVEARHLSLFPQQILLNSEMMNGNGIGNGNGNGYNCGAGYGLPPLSGTTTETLLPMYGCGVIDSVPVKADSGLTYSLTNLRKRSRDTYSMNPLMSFATTQAPNQIQCSNQIQNNFLGGCTFLGEDISLQIQQQQMEIDRIVAQHAENVRMELEERRKRNSRRIITAVEEGIMKRLRAKEEEIAKIGRINWTLEERVKSLCVENQIWRELAQTNEATANALRSNLEQVLSQAQLGRNDDGPAGLADDAESCCGSNYCDEGRTTEEQDSKSSNYNYRMCRVCGKEESCVLLLPCRHLCLCDVCASSSSVNVCPICKSTHNASVHVNLS